VMFWCWCWFWSHVADSLLLLNQLNTYNTQYNTQIWLIRAILVKHRSLGFRDNGSLIWTIITVKILSCVKWWDTWFVLVIECIGLLKPATTSNCSAVANSRTHQFTTPCTVTRWVHLSALHGIKDYVNWTFIHYKGPWTRDLPAGIIQPFPLNYRAPQCVLIVKK
jgi:hypothetical protein